MEHFSSNVEESEEVDDNDDDDDELSLGVLWRDLGPLCQQECLNQASEVWKWYSERCVKSPKPQAVHSCV
jgi:hypothetical protein